MEAHTLLFLHLCIPCILQSLPRLQQYISPTFFGIFLSRIDSILRSSGIHKVRNGLCTTRTSIPSHKDQNHNNPIITHSYVYVVRHPFPVTGLIAGSAKWSHQLRMEVSSNFGATEQRTLTGCEAKLVVILFVGTRAVRAHIVAVVILCSTPETICILFA